MAAENFAAINYEHHAAQLCAEACDRLADSLRSVSEETRAWKDPVFDICAQQAIGAEQCARLIRSMFGVK